MSYYDNDDLEENNSYEEQNSTIDDISDIYDDYQSIKERINSQKNPNNNPSKNFENINEKSSGGSINKVNKAAKSTESGAKAANTAQKGAKVADTANKGAKAAKAGKTAATVGKAAATVGKAAATAGEAAAGPVGWVLLGADILLSNFRKLKQKRKEERENPAKKQKSVEKKSKIAIILASPFLIPIGLLFICGMGLTVAQNVTTINSTNRVNDYVECMQTDQMCQDVGELKLDEQKKGFNKPLIVLNYSELRKLAEGYTEFSNKYFKNGEGVFDYNKPSIEKAFGIEGANILTKEKLDMVMLVNCFSIEAMAFANINWVEVWLDRETNVEHQRLLDKEEDFDTFYESGKDNSDNSDIVQYFSWFSGNANYAIKIPKVEKYSKSKSIVRNITSSETFEGTVKDKDVIGSVEALPPNLDSDEAVTTYKPEVITEEFKMSELERYYDMVKDYLPRWYEIYAFYLNCGSMEDTKDFYNSYLNNYGKITVKLLKVEDLYDIETKTVTYTTTKTTKEAEETNENGETTVKEETTEKKETKVVSEKSRYYNEGYATVVVSGANAWYSRLLDREAILEFTPSRIIHKNKNRHMSVPTRKDTIDTNDDGKKDTTIEIITDGKIELYVRKITYSDEPLRGIRLHSCESEEDYISDEEKQEKLDKIVNDYVEAIDNGINPYEGTPLEGGPFAGTPLEFGPNAGNPGDPGKPSEWIRDEPMYRAAAEEYFRRNIVDIREPGQADDCGEDIVEMYHDYLDPSHRYKGDYLEIRFTAAIKSFYEENGKTLNLSDYSAALEVVLEYYKNQKDKNNTLPKVSMPSGITSEDDPSVTSDKSKGYASKYTTSTGKTYRSYKQDQEGAYYANLDYGGYGPFSSWGCPLTSAAIMLDMLEVHVDPYELYQKVGAQTPDNAINNYTGKTLYTVSWAPSKENIKQWVEKGYPVGVHVGYDHNSHNQHYMVITDYDSKTGKFYVEGVHTAYTTGLLSYEEIREKNTGEGIDMIFIPVS